MRPNITIIAKARPLEAGCPDNWIVLGLLIALSLLSLGKPFFRRAYFDRKRIVLV